MNARLTDKVENILRLLLSSSQLLESITHSGWQAASCGWQVSLELKEFSIARGFDPGRCGCFSEGGEK